MKLVDTTCPHCGAQLKLDENQKNLNCEFCGAKLIVDDEVKHLKIDDAEELGYQLEKGRQRAKAEKSAQNEKTAPTKSNNIRRLVVTAMLIGLGTALSLVRFQMPLGGEITLLSMLPIALISIEYGIGWGLVGSFVFSLIQLGLQFGMVASWGLSAAAFAGCIALDYILAYTSIGLSGILRKKGIIGICAGIFIALLTRFAFHLLSGTIIFAEWMPADWSNPLLYSVCYNGIYMLPEFIITTIGAVVLFKIPSFNKLVGGNIQ